MHVKRIKHSAKIEQVKFTKKHRNLLRIVKCLFSHIKDQFS